MNDFYEVFEKYKEQRLKKRRFKHKDLMGLLSNIPFENKTVGYSFEQRAINKIVIGQGPITVLMWTQMHGNEASATMAMVDMIRFFEGKNDGFDTYRDQIKKSITLHLVPMLNPDGTEKFIRRTAQGIDMNRDAVALACPESVLLKKLVDELKPAFSFNLHDQNTLYSVAQTPKQATISFLATAYNEACDWNATRTQARQIISSLHLSLQAYIPKGVGRFSDEFEPRAFGDNIQKWGSSLILVESGGYPNDPEKQYIRKLNFCILLESLKTISENKFHHFTLDQYLDIPQNDRCLFDLKIKNASMEINAKKFQLDIGINKIEKNDSKATKFCLESVIEDMGDLSTFFGIQEYDATNATIRPISHFPNMILKHKIKNKDCQTVEMGNRASFVLDFGDRHTLVLNGEIIS